jgi:hypothetical protein
MAFMSRYLVLAVCISFIPGCFQVETTVRVNPDGSGTIEERMLMSRMIIKQFDEMSRAFADPDEKPKPFTLHEGEKLRKRAANLGQRVVYVSSSALDDDSYSGYKALYSFSDINKVRLSSAGKEAMPGDGEEGGTIDGAVEFKYFPGATSRLVIIMPRNENAGKPSDSRSNNSEEPPMTPEQKKEFGEMMKGMRFSLAVEVKGMIVKTNATQCTGNRITLFEFDLDRMGGGFEELQKLQSAGGEQAPTLADARNLLKSLPGVSVELNDQVEVLFKK